MLIQCFMDSFTAATYMIINITKSSIPWLNISQEGSDWIYAHMNYPPVTLIDNGIKYLGFILNSNAYLRKDWAWLVAKIEKRLLLWCNK